MVLDAVSNFVRGETDASVDNSQTTVSVVDASIFPDPSTDGEFNVVIWDAPNFPRPDQDPDTEIMRVTAIDTGTDTLTVARGQEMTGAAAHPSGSAIHLSPTAKMFSDIESTFADFWDAGTQTLTADVNNGSVDTANILINGSILSPGDYLTVMGGSPTEELSDVTSTSFTAVANLAGVFNTSNIPAGATLYGEFQVRGSISDGNETLTVRPSAISGSAIATFDELEVTITSTGNETASTGETEITSDLSASNFWRFWDVQATVTGGAGSFVGEEAQVAFYWRVD